MPEIKMERVKIVVYTTDFIITGEIPTHEGYRGRLSDLLNEERRFLNITGVEIRTRTDNKVIHTANFLCLNKDSIILVYPPE